MARHRRMNTFQAGELNLTAMIDVAFQLLAFFILTAHPVDVMANLTVNRPRPEVGQGPDISAIQITVFPAGYTVNGTAMTLDEIAGKLKRIASLEKAQPIIIQCVGASNHSQLVDLLNICAGYGLANLSVLSSQDS